LTIKSSLGLKDLGSIPRAGRPPTEEKVQDLTHPILQGLLKEA
jgi:hypothetical protein